MKGKLLIFSGPSGSGKTTIVHHLLEVIPDLEFSVSATSRKKRPDETDGKDYFFITAKKFREKIIKNEFVEWEEVYVNQYYGTLKSEIERILNLGRNVVFDVDVRGGINIKKQYGKDALAIFVMPPSLKELEKRLRARLTEDEDSFRKRIGKAREEIGFSDQFDVVLVNDELNNTMRNSVNLVNNFLKNKEL
jgi:guanylate kinase